MPYKYKIKFPKLGVASSNLVYRSSSKSLKIKQLHRKGGKNNRLFLLYLALKIGLLGAI